MIQAINNTFSTMTPKVESTSKYIVFPNRILNPMLHPEAACEDSPSVVKSGRERVPLWANVHVLQPQSLPTGDIVCTCRRSRNNDRRRLKLLAAICQ